MKDRTLSWLPRVTKSKIDNDDPSLVMPYIDNEDPNRT
jgi:hypothetical protein